MTGYAAGRSLEKVRGRHKVIPYLPPAPARDRRVWRSWEVLLSGLAAKLFVIAVVVGPVARFHHRAVLGLLALSLLQAPGADKAQGRQEDGKDRGDAGAATAANGRLRKSLADYRARHANATASTGQGEPGSDPIGVLSELLGRMGEAGERISRYADEVKIAGAACEAAR